MSLESALYGSGLSSSGNLPKICSKTGRLTPAFGAIVSAGASADALLANANKPAAPNTGMALRQSRQKS